MCIHFNTKYSQSCKIFFSSDKKLLRGFGSDSKNAANLRTFCFTISYSHQKIPLKCPRLLVLLLFDAANYWWPVWSFIAYFWAKYWRPFRCHFRLVVSVVPYDLFLLPEYLSKKYSPHSRTGWNMWLHRPVPSLHPWQLRRTWLSRRLNSLGERYCKGLPKRWGRCHLNWPPLYRPLPKRKVK